VVFISAGAVCVNQLAVMTGQSHLVLGPLGIAAAIGLAYGVALACTLPFSNGFLNPAITLMFWVFKRFDGLKTAALVAVQLLGAAIAGGLLRIVYPQEVLLSARFGTPHLNFAHLGEFGKGALLRGVVLEFGLTFILAFVIYAIAVDPRVPKKIGDWGRRLVGFWLGLTLAAITLAALPVTGAGINPARWFGTVIWEKSIGLTGTFDDQLVYWFGPIAGALVAGVIYNLLLLPAEEEHPAVAPPASATAKVGAAATLFRAKK
jgi:aquaporin Z